MSKIFKIMRSSNTKGRFDSNKKDSSKSFNKNDKTGRTTKFSDNAKMASGPKRETKSRVSFDSKPTRGKSTTESTNKDEKGK